MTIIVLEKTVLTSKLDVGNLFIFMHENKGLLFAIICFIAPRHAF